MCGIYLSCNRDDVLNPANALLSRLERRGPDCSKIIERTIRQPAFPGVVQKPSPRLPIHLKFLSTVLSLRGDVVVEQPLIDPASKSILCWNGEAWKIDDKVVVGNDAVAVLDLLNNYTNLEDRDSSTQRCRNGSNECRVVDAMSRITGPYAFVYYDAHRRQIFYGRDVLGRRSLLVNKHQKGSFAISSICDPETPEGWVEVEPNCIHVLDLFAEQDILSLVTEEQHFRETYNFSRYAEVNHQVRENSCYRDSIVTEVTQVINILRESTER